MSDLNPAAIPIYYRHSGQAPVLSTTFAAIASWIVVSVLALAYAYADLNFKWYDIISVLIVGVFAAGMGLAVYGILRSANIRNLPVVIIISVSSALLALYVSWVGWEYFLLRQGGNEVPLVEMLKRPDLVWETASEINAEGTWGLRSGPVKGPFLWIVWVIEALTIVALVGGLPPQLLRNLSFCENCGRWCNRPKGIMRMVYGDEAMLKSNMEQRNFAYLAAMPRADMDTPLHFHVELVRCGTCDETSLLNVSRVKVGRDSKGNRSESKTKIVNRLHISVEDADEIAAMGAPPAEAETSATAMPQQPG
jgi:hypothetical protein